MAGCETPTISAGHAPGGAQVDHELTFNPDHPMGADHPTLVFPRDIPIEGEPADVCAAVEEYAAWLAQYDIPKLFIKADPGVIMTGRTLEFARSWRKQSEVTVKGLHMVPEDSPHEIGAAIAQFLGSLAGPAAPR